MVDITCTSKSSALEALTAIAATMKKGTVRDALASIAAWINENMTDVLMPEETQKRLDRIFRGSEEEQKGRDWIESEMKDEPEHGAVLSCYWDSNSKSWLPVSKRPRP